MVHSDGHQYESLWFQVLMRGHQLLPQVNEGEFHTKNGLSYLESKHLLLLFYCQSIVFYILLKANGRSVENHPVIARLIEIRLFLEKANILFKI